MTDPHNGTEHPHGPTGNGRYRTRFDPTRDSASEAVVRAVATLEDVGHDELPPLATSIDTDALAAVLGVGPSSGVRNTDARVKFEYAGYTVTLTSDGLLTLEFADNPVQKPL